LDSADPLCHNGLSVQKTAPSHAHGYGTAVIQQYIEELPANVGTVPNPYTVKFCNLDCKMYSLLIVNPLTVNTNKGTISPNKWLI